MNTSIDTGVNVIYMVDKRKRDISTEDQRDVREENIRTSIILASLFNSLNVFLEG